MKYSDSVDKGKKFRTRLRWFLVFLAIYIASGMYLVFKYTIIQPDFLWYNFQYYVKVYNSGSTVFDECGNFQLCKYDNVIVGYTKDNEITLFPADNCVKPGVLYANAFNNKLRYSKYHDAENYFAAFWKLCFFVFLKYSLIPLGGFLFLIVLIKTIGLRKVKHEKKHIRGKELIKPKKFQKLLRKIPVEYKKWYHKLPYLFTFVIVVLYNIFLVYINLLTVFVNIFLSLNHYIKKQTDKKSLSLFSEIRLYVKYGGGYFNFLYLKSKKSFPISKHIRMASYMETKNILIIGAPGAGKTHLLNQQLEYLKKQNAKVVLLETKCDFLPRFYEPEKTYILNPMDKLHCGWDFKNELFKKDGIYLIDTFAETIISKNTEHTNDYFINTSRKILATLMKIALITDRFNNKDLLSLVNLPVEKKLKLFHEYPEIAQSAINIFGEQMGSSGQRDGINSVLADSTTFLEYLSETSGNFSIKNWIKNPNDKNWVIIPYKKDQRSILRPFTSFVLDRCFSEILDLADDRNRRIYIVFDEMETLNYLPTFLEFLNMSRSKGGSVICGTQSFGGIEYIYGKSGLNKMYGGIGTQICFMVNDDFTQKYLSTNFGQKEITVNQATRQEGRNRTISISQQEKYVPLVLASELGSLEDGNVYIRSRGEFISKDIVGAHKITKKHSDEIFYNNRFEIGAFIKKYQNTDKEINGSDVEISYAKEDNNDIAHLMNLFDDEFKNDLELKALLEEYLHNNSFEYVKSAMEYIKNLKIKNDINLYLSKLADILKNNQHESSN